MSKRKAENRNGMIYKKDKEAQECAAFTPGEQKDTIWQTYLWYLPGGNTK